MSDDPVPAAKLASLLLSYPDEPVRAALGAVEERDLRRLGRERRGVERLLAHYAATPASELCRSYAQTFDFSKPRSLHLTYHVHGDSRARGMALLRLKQAYDAAGFDLVADELPDFLPLMLEFAALVPKAGEELLAQHKVSIELVRASLDAERSPWAPALDLVAAMLPGMTAREVAKLRRLAASGPPTEEVGLEPFAPPEMLGAGR